MARQIGDLSHALSAGVALARRLVGKQLVVFLDYDGTLTAIRDRLRQAATLPLEVAPAGRGWGHLHVSWRNTDAP